MPIDFKKPADVLVVHGVQTSEDGKIESHKQISALMNRALADSHIVDKEFAVRGFFYEDINDKAQKFYQLIAKALTAGKPIEGKILELVIDIVGDVVTAAKDTSTAGKIRGKLRKEILKSYSNGRQLLLVSHSLGTIYALNAIVDLIGDGRYFKGDKIATWPVQGFVTMGSPLGLGLEFAGAKIFEKRVIKTVPGAQAAIFPWHNYYNTLDPVVSGSLFGVPTAIEGSQGPVERRYGPDLINTNWKLRGHAVTSGHQWLFAHVQYWTNPAIGDQIIDMLWG
jgi:hypothetical protein